MISRSAQEMAAVSRRNAVVKLNLNMTTSVLEKFPAGSAKGRFLPASERNGISLIQDGRQRAPLFHRRECIYPADFFNPFFSVEQLQIP